MAFWIRGLTIVLFVAAVFCCVSALAITGSLDRVDKDLLGWWLCERQVKSGGLNGRPEKLPDVGIIINFVGYFSNFRIFLQLYFFIWSGLLLLVGSL